MTLPIVEVPHRFARNPDWVMGDPPSDFYLKGKKSLGEVMSIHLNAGTMRVRLMNDDGTPSKDCIESDLTAFTNAYKIVPNENKTT